MFNEIWCLVIKSYEIAGSDSYIQSYPQTDTYLNLCTVLNVQEGDESTTKIFLIIFLEQAGDVCVQYYDFSIMFTF